MRETIESIVVAVMLALMFRAYEAEAFVIPTGSMAPTLQGRHLDTDCPKCGYEYITGASSENPDRNLGTVFETTCPICRFEQPHDRQLTGFFKSNEDSFNGDRILVSKFAYDLADPKRWDVIVFNFPGNAKQNYIKRLVGLPGETLKIINGDIYVKRDGEDYRIVRKPPHKLKVMLQLVDDTDYMSDQLLTADWPSRWNQWDEADESKRNWQVSDSHQQFTINGSENGDEATWLSYRHLVPRSADWNLIQRGETPDRIKGNRGELITDYYAYNDSYTFKGNRPGLTRSDSVLAKNLGINWVGDLAIETEMKIDSDAGSVGFDLVEAGAHFRCWIDVATGVAEVSSSDDSIHFGGSDATKATGQTKIKGAGKYDVRFANADNELTLWVNNRVVEFDKPLTFDRENFLPPVYSEQDAADAQPVSVGSRGASLTVNRLKVLRDIYYVPYDNANGIRPRRIAEDPALWSQESSIATLRDNAFGMEREYDLEAGQFMPMGDNSPQSLDARAWDKHYVDRDMLTGKALFVYWPHAWRPFMPNFRRMGFIR